MDKNDEIIIPTVVAINESANTVYYCYRKVNNPKEIDSLFISSTGNPYSLRTYQAAFKELLIKCNIENKYSPRNLRSTFLKEMAKKVPLSELKAISNQDKLKQYYKI